MCCQVENDWIEVMSRVICVCEGEDGEKCGDKCVHAEGDERHDGWSG